MNTTQPDNPMDASAAWAAVSAKYPSVAREIAADKGEQWVLQNLWCQTASAEEGLGELIYYHFLESDVGQKEWGRGSQTEDKVDRITAAIEETYTRGGGSITLDERTWVAISGHIGDAVYEGVF